MVLMDFSEEVPAATHNLIVCGEIIEPVASPQNIFRSAARVLRPRGRVVLATPNPFFTRRILNATRWRTQKRANPIALFTPANIAEMAMQEGMLLESYRGVLDPGRMTTLRAPHSIATTRLVAVLAGGTVLRSHHL
jgi:2-polyprenyl-3-methyl-5-hydroxy-6-metoxy-1,4-benzoquinol methylase